MSLLGMRQNEAGRTEFALAVTNVTDRATTFRPPPKPSDSRPVAAVEIGPGAGRAVSIDVPRPGVGDHEVRLVLSGDNQRPAFIGRVDLSVGFLERGDFGHRFADSGKAKSGFWWCESGWKVGRTLPAPELVPGSEPRPLSVRAARGEFEAAQLVIHKQGRLTAVEVGTFRDVEGYPANLSVSLAEVAYVRVTHPTDSTSERGWYPDPLPPLRLPLVLPPGANLPLWLTFQVPREARAGEHTAELVLKIDEEDGMGERRYVLPLRVEVYDFELPRETHLRSALGLGSSEINRYHRLTNRADQVAVFEKYLRNFADHRISPYSFYDHAPIDVGFEGEGPDKRPRVDFTKFDAAATRWLGEGGFNTFQLPLRGMGGGTFHSRHPGELEGFAEGTPEHTRLFRDYLGQVERHLREKGWLEKAFTYWFDEPDPKDYEFVVAGQKRIKDAAPGLKRMMTEQPEKELLGQVDIWCGLTPEWTPEKVRARREAGEEVWWYICTAPKAPYVTEFIDHPGTELRLWPWQSWQYGVTGILVWATVYWNSPEAYPGTLQDPWVDPMSWVTSYGTPPGTRNPWGNGDGRFLYPPRRDPNMATEPSLDGPIDSIRWENLRDGMEDYEYFWLLAEEVKRVEALEGTKEWLAGAKRLLIVPEAVSKNLTQFTTDPRPILEHRDQVARMIERLKGIR
ncbi:MAG: DUF4091 domain-containing protein [Limisphaerales bacterium]